MYGTLLLVRTFFFQLADSVYFNKEILKYTFKLSVCNSSNDRTVICTAVLTLGAGLMARSRYPEGPATGHLDTFFLTSSVSTSEC